MHTVWIVLSLLQPAIHPDYVAMFKPLEFRYTGGQYEDELFRYRLYVPPASDQARPLLVWLHGYGERGDDNVIHLKWLDELIFHSFDPTQFPFYVLVVQCPKNNGEWTRVPPRWDDMINVTAAILDKTLDDYPIDRQRVYLSGLSSGGTGVWQMALRFPDRFAAIAPLASAGGGTVHVDRLVDVPVWAFHSRDDLGTSILGVRLSIDALRGAGGNAYLTEIESDQHNCWSAAFEDYHLLDWLMAQRRGQASTPPGTIPWIPRLRSLVEDWHWWQFVLQVTIPLLVLAAVWRAVRARHRTAPSQTTPA